MARRLGEPIDYPNLRKGDKLAYTGWNDDEKRKSAYTFLRWHSDGRMVLGTGPDNVEVVYSVDTFTQHQWLYWALGESGPLSGFSKFLKEHAL